MTSNTVVPLIGAALLVARDREESNVDSVAPTAASPAAVARPSAAPAFSAAEGISIGEFDLAIPFTHRILFDREEDKNGVKVRQVFIEANTSPVSDVSVSLKQALSAAGFEKTQHANFREVEVLR